ncbi:MAG: site-2 protease family protein [Candidatus Korarchaeota archaeon]
MSNGENKPDDISYSSISPEMISEEERLKLTDKYVPVLFGFYYNNIFIVVTVPERFEFAKLFNESKSKGFYVTRIRVPSKELVKILAPQSHSYLTEHEYVFLIRFIPIPHQESRKSKNILNVILFFSTIATVLLAGWFFSIRYSSNVGGNFIFDMLSYVLGLMTIICAHEMGHYLIARHHGIASTLPYFIPGLPWSGGTFGAFISQKDPFIDRKTMLDIGAAGPLSGFVPALFIYILGLPLSKITPISAVENGVFLPTPILLYVIMEFTRPIPPGYVLLLHPLALAGYIGILITGLQTIPAGQLDGGHVARALFSERTHLYLGYISLLFLALLGYWSFAILVLFLASKPHPPPLDEVEPLPPARKIIAAFVIVIGILCLVGL